ncbi:hypothetical protein [Clostridium sp.]|uniref:hypothetical protein n=1 Tax=Clostridium sp. TaxID=1506 RepID=UPI002FCB5F1D
MRKKLEIFDGKLDDRKFYYECIKGMTNILEHEITSAELDDDEVYKVGSIIEEQTWVMFLGQRPPTPVQVVFKSMMEKYYDNIARLREFEKAEYALLEEYNYPVPKVTKYSFA